MNKIIVFTTAFSMLSCNLYKRGKFQYNEDERHLWINAYKYEVFYGCIKHSIQNDSLRIILNDRDLFNPNLNFELSAINEARKLGENVIIKIPKAIIKIDVGEENLKNKNYISYTCLKYYASFKLDSIAQSEYKKYKKNKWES